MRYRARYAENRIACRDALQAALPVGWENDNAPALLRGIAQGWADGHQSILQGMPPRIMIELASRRIPTTDDPNLHPTRAGRLCPSGGPETTLLPEGRSLVRGWEDGQMSQKWRSP